MDEEAIDDTSPLLRPRSRRNGSPRMHRRPSSIAGKRYHMTLPWAGDSEQEPISNTFLYTAYYVPFLSWLPQYRWRWLHRDFLAAITVASLYIPMCFSFAIIAQVNPTSGLYAFIIHPFIYAVLGSSPQMVVGPEATGSLLVGSVLRQIQSTMGDDSHAAAEISGVVTAIAGAMLLAAGIGRIGFVDSMLSRPFMQGFISGVGFVLIVEQALPELGLKELAREMGYNRSSAVVKIGFLISNLDKTHVLTAAVSLSTLAFILNFRAAQKLYRSRFPALALMPDRLVAIAVTTILTWQLRLDKRGLEVLGALETKASSLPEFHSPFASWSRIELTFPTAFLASLFGFFESCVTARSLRSEKSELHNTQLSANRELIALGTANLVGGCFTTLPAFGGFGRSKLNVQAGGTTPMCSIFLSLITLLCVFFILPGLHFVPRGVLSAMATAVGISMMEDCPDDIRFFIKIRGWRELSLMATVFLSTACYSMSLGIAIGIVLTLFTVIRQAAQPRIQILGRIPGTKDVFENAEQAPEGDQFDQCLIVRIPEPLTFTNSGNLRGRLKRLEWYGAHYLHPSQPRVRQEDSYLIFDVQGLTQIDACAVQILTEIVQDYTENGVQIIFCRFPPGILKMFQRSGIVDICGGIDYFVEDVEVALRLTGATE